MSLNDSYPDVDEVLASIGEAGVRMSDLAATAGAAGNLSLCVAWPLACASSATVNVIV